MAVDLSSFGQIPLGKQGQAAIKNASAGLNQSAPAPSAPFSGSSTKLQIAGQTGFQQPSPSLPQFQLNQQGNIPGVTPPPAPTTQVAPGVFQRQGETVAKELSQFKGPPSHPPLTNSDGSDTEFGMLIKMGADKGQANPSQNQQYRQILAEWQASHPLPPPPPVPVPPPTPTLPLQTQVQAKPVGSTAALPSVTGVGAVGQTAFPAMTPAGLAGKDLQTIKGLTLPDLGISMAPQSARMIPTIPVKTTPMITPDVLQRLQGSLEARTIQTPQAQQEKGRVNTLEDDIRMYGKGPVPTPVPGQDIARSQEQAYQEWAAKQPKPASNLIASSDPRAIGTPGAIYNPQITSKGIQKTPVSQPMATYEQLAGTLPVEQHGQAVQMYTSGQASKEDVAQAIASPEAKITISKMINQAVKAGDMASVAKLAELSPAIDEQLAFIDQIGRRVIAMAKGFGTPNAPGVTEARTPLVQQGVGQALTSAPVSMPPSSLRGTDNAAQYLAPRLESVSPTQINRPVLYPYTNGR